MSPRTRTVIATSLLGVILCGTPAAHAGSTVIDSSWRPYSYLVYVGCANGGLGESIAVTGTAHFVTRTTTVGTMIAITFNGTAVGAESGDTYLARFAAKTQGQLGPSVVASGRDTVLYLGLGTGAKLIAHTVFHITRLSDGSYAVLLSTFREACRAA
jgi:hypothetical protein